MAISSHFRAGEQVNATLRSFVRLDMSANNQLIEMPRDEVTEIDAAETRDWIESLDAVASCAGAERARYLLQQLEARALQLGIRSLGPPYSAYRTSISLPPQPPHPRHPAPQQRTTPTARSTPP